MNASENPDPKELKRWKLLLQLPPSFPNEDESLQSDGFNQREKNISKLLEGLYHTEKGKAGFGKSSPKLNKWLGDIRKYFSKSIVLMMQNDAIHKHGLEELLLENEILDQLDADVHLVATLLSLKQALPDKVRSSARVVVNKVVKELQKKFTPHLFKSVARGVEKTASSRHRILPLTDWNRLIRANLKHYQPSYNSIIPENWYSYKFRLRGLKHLILLVDQSASMSESIIYASIFGSILASLSSLRTDLILFDTQIADLSKELNDPIEILFASHLGGGTNIAKALRYASQKISNPSDTFIFLISDLDEAGSIKEMLSELASIKNAGCSTHVLLNLSDEGSPYFHSGNAKRVSMLNIPCFACTPDEFPNLVESIF